MDESTECACPEEYDTIKTHPCPFQEDIENNGSNYCSCCDLCMEQCRDDI